MLRYLALFRVVNISIIFVSVIVAALLVHSSFTNVFTVIAAAVAASLTAAAGNIINDYYDISVDEINKPFRPLAAGDISTTSALLLYFLINIAALFISLLIGTFSFLLVAAAQILLYLYSFKFKKIPITGNIVIASLTGLVFIFGADAAGDIKAGYVPALFAFMINFIREIVKDIEDIKGDSASGMKTLPIVRGIKITKTIILGATFILILFTFLPFIYNYYSIEFFIIAMAVVNPVLVYFLKSLYHDHSVENLSKLSLLLKVNMLVGLIAIYAGR